MRIKNYKIEHPFMCRAGQFEEGRSLCIGVRKSYLVGYDMLNIKVGKKIYRALTADLLTRKSTPDIRKGVNLLIVPLFYFEIVDEEEKIEPQSVSTLPPTQGRLI